MIFILENISSDSPSVPCSSSALSSFQEWSAHLPASTRHVTFNPEDSKPVVNSSSYFHFLRMCCIFGLALGSTRLSCCFLFWYISTLLPSLAIDRIFAAGHLFLWSPLQWLTRISKFLLPGSLLIISFFLRRNPPLPFRVACSTSCLEIYLFFDASSKNQPSYAWILGPPTPSGNPVTSPPLSGPQSFLLE